MANTYFAIAKNVLTSNQSSVTFSSIPQTYTDLLLLASARSSTNGQIFGSIFLSPNSGLTRFTEIYGSGTALVSWSDLSHSGYGAAGSTSTSNIFGNHEIYIANYSNTSIRKFISSTGVGENNATAAYMSINASSYNFTTAITSLVITIDGGNIASGSRFDLYGIKNT